MELRYSILPRDALSRGPPKVPCALAVQRHLTPLAAQHISRRSADSGALASRLHIRLSHPRSSSYIRFLRTHHDEKCPRLARTGRDRLPVIIAGVCKTKMEVCIKHAPLAQFLCFFITFICNFIGTIICVSCAAIHSLFCAFCSLTLSSKLSTLGHLVLQYAFHVGLSLVGGGCCFECGSACVRASK